MKYNSEYSLQNLFAQQPRLIKTPRLFNLDEPQTYAAMMDRLAQPLPNGESSPFSSRSPATGHGYLIGTFLHLLSMQAHELNLVPDIVWLKLLQFLGTELSPAEYPLINITFSRSDDAIASNIPVTISLRTKVESIYVNGLFAYTTVEKTISGQDKTVDIPCRLSEIGAAPAIRVGEFSRLPRMMSFVAEASNDGTIVNPGRSQETLPEAALRVREELKTGKRCISLSDYVYWAYALGSDLGVTKATAVSAVAYQVYGNFKNLVTVMIHPGENAERLYDLMEPMTVAQRSFDVIPAEIIPVTGVISVKAIESLTNGQIFDLAATAIVNEINPPFGLWGDKDFPDNLSTALEKTQGIYAVKKLELKNVYTDRPLEELEIHPWHLFQIQDTLQINVLRD